MKSFVITLIGVALGALLTNCQYKSCMQTVEARQTVVNQTTSEQTLELKVSIKPEVIKMTLVFAPATTYTKMLFSTYEYERHPAHTGRISLLMSEPSCDQIEKDNAILQLADPAGVNVKLCRTHNYSAYYIVEKTEDCPDLTTEVLEQ